jgi:hypothetical protein
MQELEAGHSPEGEEQGEKQGRGKDTERWVRLRLRRLVVRGQQGLGEGGDNFKPGKENSLTTSSLAKKTV